MLTFILPEYYIHQQSRHAPPHLRRRIDILRAILQPHPCERDIFESGSPRLNIQIRVQSQTLCQVDDLLGIVDKTPTRLNSRKTYARTTGADDPYADSLCALGESEALEMGCALVVEVEESWSFDRPAQ